jgi:hypothetical protein
MTRRTFHVGDQVRLQGMPEMKGWVIRVARRGKEVSVKWEMLSTQPPHDLRRARKPARTLILDRDSAPRVSLTGHRRHR